MNHQRGCILYVTLRRACSYQQNKNPRCFRSWFVIYFTRRWFRFSRLSPHFIIMFTNNIGPLPKLIYVLMVLYNHISRLNWQFLQCNPYVWWSQVFRPIVRAINSWKTALDSRVAYFIQKSSWSVPCGCPFGKTDFVTCGEHHYWIVSTPSSFGWSAFDSVTGGWISGWAFCRLSQFFKEDVWVWRPRPASTFHITHELIFTSRVRQTKLYTQKYGFYPREEIYSLLYKGNSFNDV